MKKYFYCEKCDEFPDEIVEEYSDEPLVEKRKWNGECYELVDSNIGSIEIIIRRCGKCGEKLVLRGAM